MKKPPTDCVTNLLALAGSLLIMGSIAWAMLTRPAFALDVPVTGVTEQATVQTTQTVAVASVRVEKIEIVLGREVDGEQPLLATVTYARLDAAGNVLSRGTYTAARAHLELLLAAQGVTLENFLAPIRGATAYVAEHPE